MFDTEKGIFALDQPILRPTLIGGLKLQNVSLGPKSMILQRSGRLYIQGESSFGVTNLANPSSASVDDPGTFFADMVVNDFECGRSMMAVIAMEQPRKPVIQQPIELTVEEQASEESREVSSHKSF